LFSLPSNAKECTTPPYQHAQEQAEWLWKGDCEMAYNPAIHHRRSIRLKGYDYSQEGMYFVMI